jgi:hypothetical protein
LLEGLVSVVDRLSQRENSVVADETLIDEFMRLCAEASGRDSVVHSVDSWLHTEGRGYVAEVRERLLRDPVIAAIAQPDTSVMVAGAGGWGVDLDLLIRSAIRQLVRIPPEERSKETRRFLRFLRLSEGTAPMTVRTTLVGLDLERGRSVDLPFGRLRAAQPIDFAGSPYIKEADLPPGAVFEYQTELPARFVRTYEPLAIDESWQAHIEEVERKHDERVARLLLALVLVREGPVQEHFTMRSPRYVGGGIGINPVPLAPLFLSYPHGRGAGVPVEDLKEAATRVATIHLGGLGVAVRRYLLAVTERIRPADQIVDCSIAFEALTGKGHGPAQGKALADLIGATLPGLGSISAAHKTVKDARDLIMHTGSTPANAASIASIGTTLVRFGIETTVRSANHSSP